MTGSLSIQSAQMLVQIIEFEGDPKLFPTTDSMFME